MLNSSDVHKPEPVTGWVSQLSALTREVSAPASAPASLPKRQRLSADVDAALAVYRLERKAYYRDFRAGHVEMANARKRRATVLRHQLIIYLSAIGKLEEFLALMNPEDKSVSFEDKVIRQRDFAISQGASADMWIDYCGDGEPVSHFY